MTEEIRPHQYNEGGGVWPQYVLRETKYVEHARFQTLPEALQQWDRFAFCIVRGELVGGDGWTVTQEQIVAADAGEPIMWPPTGAPGCHGCRTRDHHIAELGRIINRRPVLNLRQRQAPRIIDLRDKP